MLRGISGHIFGMNHSYHLNDLDELGLREFVPWCFLLIKLDTALMFWHKSFCFKSYLLQDISVELLLAIAEKLSNHLPAQPLPLQQEVSHTNRCVGDEPPLSQILDALFWLPETHKDELQYHNWRENSINHVQF